VTPLNKSSPISYLSKLSRIDEMKEKSEALKKLLVSAKIKA
jgi:hypothetical protein